MSLLLTKYMVREIITPSATDKKSCILRRYLIEDCTDRADDKDVTRLQNLLLALDFNPGTIDGQFGKQTYLAVTNFQSKNLLDVDGIVGEQTWLALGGTKFESKYSYNIRQKIADFSEAEAKKNLKWNGGNSEAEKYLKPFRPVMQKLGHIGKDVVFYNWCAAYAAYCCRACGVDIPDIHDRNWASMALVEMWKVWAKDQGYWYTKSQITPKRGDVIVFDWNGDAFLDHIGFVRTYVAGSSVIYTSEGNHGNVRQSGLWLQNMKNVQGFIRID